MPSRLRGRRRLISMMTEEAKSNQSGASYTEMAGNDLSFLVDPGSFNHGDIDFSIVSPPGVLAHLPRFALQESHFSPVDGLP